MSRSNSQHVLRRRSQSAEVACPAPTFRGSWMAKSDKPTCSKCPGGVHRRSPTVQLVHWQPHLPTHTRNRRWRLQGPINNLLRLVPTTLAPRVLSWIRESSGEGRCRARKKLLLPATLGTCPSTPLPVGPDRIGWWSGEDGGTS
jgi:hypothetical protein